MQQNFAGQQLRLVGNNAHGYVVQAEVREDLLGARHQPRQAGQMSAVDRRHEAVGFLERAAGKWCP